MSISRDEWLKALNDAGESVEDDRSAVTIAEFGQMFGGLSRASALLKLKRLVAAGKAVETRKRTLNGYGRTQSLIAYRLVS